MKRFIIIVLAFLWINSSAQELTISKIEPPNWWAGHSYNKVQLMVYGNNLDFLNVSISCDKIKILKVSIPENTNYAFVDIEIEENVKPDDYTITFSNKYGKEEFIYQFLPLENSVDHHKGFSNEDVVYLIFPDRFNNGDSSNDFVFNQNEEFEFGSLNGRHGGDIQGISDKLDYLVDLGITAIWVTPLLENNMYMSYHGYAATNLYKIDPRHGTNELYKKLVNTAHQKGIKVILDHVANHIGINHEWINNLPTPTWINGRPGNHLPADHNKTAHVDIHSTVNSKRKISNGWFTDYMPDLNQCDTLLAKYIIQNTIWWIEYSGIDGIREDTYPYADQKFMAVWAKEILTHYPDFNIVGEVWKGEAPILAAFQTNSYFPKEFDTNLPVVTDFAFRDVLIEYLSGKSNLTNIYEIFGQDFVYSNPNDLLVFFDNHDIERGMYAAKGDIFKYKVALTLTLTTRGIPQLFYGSEIGLDGGGHHGKIRQPFPGGFIDKTNNGFTESGRNEKQNEIFNFTQNLLRLRKEYPALSIGNFTQFYPKDNIYIYFKSLKDQKIVIIINDNDFDNQINIADYLEVKNYNLTELLSKQVDQIENGNKIDLPKKSILMYLIQ
jgi:glycosidase